MASGSEVVNYGDRRAFRHAGCCCCCFMLKVPTISSDWWRSLETWIRNLPRNVSNMSVGLRQFAIVGCVCYRAEDRTWSHEWRSGSAISDKKSLEICVLKNSDRSKETHSTPNVMEWMETASSSIVFIRHSIQLVWKRLMNNSSNYHFMKN